MPAPTTRLVTLALLTVGGLGLAACGSALDPSEVTTGAVQAGPARAGVATGGASTGAVGTTAAVPSSGSEPVPDGSTASLPPGVTSGGADAPAGTVGGDAPATGPGPAGPTAGGGGPTSAPSADGSTAPSGAPSASGSAGPAGPAAPAGVSCDGLADQTGVTASTITIGNASDLSGPVPGLFQAALDGTDAYVAYFNATSDICGRKLAVKSYDTKTDSGADQQAMVAGCGQVFAMIGGIAALDSGGAPAAQSCGLPVLSASLVTNAAHDCSTCFGALSTNASEFENAVPDFIKSELGGGQHAAMFYLDGSQDSGNGQSAGGVARGMHYDIVQSISPSEFNYAPYVQELKDKHIETVQFVGAIPFFARLAMAMQQAAYVPKGLVLDASAYDPAYVSAAGSAGDGTISYLSYVPYEEAARNPETQLYLSYLQQVHPDAYPTFAGLFAWSATKLFVQEAQQLGGKLTRASLVAALRGVKDWTANGLHAPQEVGAKDVGSCWRFIQLHGGTWSPIGGTKFRCEGISKV